MSEPAPADPRPRRAGAAILWLVLTLAGLAAADALRYAIKTPDLPARGVLIAAALIAAGVSIAAFARWRKGGPGRFTAARARLLFYSLVGWLAIQMVFMQPYRSATLHIALGLGLGLFPMGLALGPSLVPRAPRLFRALDVLLMNAGVLAIGGELGFRLLSRVSSSPILVQEDTTARNLLERRRLQPGLVRFGFPVNSEGMYDEEFVPREKLGAKRLVVSIGDSFSLGIVPHARHFTTVAERELGDCAIYNMGMLGTGPREYLHLLHQKGLAFKPDVVVVNVYVGNDLTPPESSAARYWFDRENLLLYQVPRRLLKLAEERHVAAPKEVDANQSWVEDPMKEAPTYSPQGHLHIQARDTRNISGKGARDYRASLAYLEEIRKEAGATPLLVTLIPTEAQVEDGLWSEVARALGDPELDRDSPQRVMIEWLSRRGVPYVDLLPLLRAVPPMTDGRRHVYHLQDGHFNARGNRVAGEALARALRPLLK